MAHGYHFIVSRFKNKFTFAPLNLLFFLCYIYSVDFGECIHPYSIAQNTFPALKILCPPPVHPFLAPPSPRSHWSFYFLHILTSRMSYSWNRIVCSLSKLAGFLHVAMCIPGSSRSRPGLMTHLLWALSNMAWYGYTAICLSVLVFLFSQFVFLFFYIPAVCHSQTVLPCALVHDAFSIYDSLPPISPSLRFHLLKSPHFFGVQIKYHICHAVVPPHLERSNYALSGLPCPRQQRHLWLLINVA